LDWEELEVWLKTQPREVSVAIAARCALRVLPLLNAPGSVDTVSDTVVLPVFRAISLAFSYADGSESARERLAANAAVVYAAAAVETAAYATAYAAAANAANAAAYAAYAATNAAAANAAANAAAYAAATTATALSSDQREINNGKRAEDLVRTSLWPDGSVPDAISKSWEGLKAALLSGRMENWTVWTDWYEDRLKGAPPEPEAVALARVLLPESTWWKGAKAVNTAIRKLIDLYNERGPEAAEVQLAALGRRRRLPGNGPSAPSSALGVEISSLGEQSPDDTPPQSLSGDTYDTDYVSDRPEADRDLLNRAPLAFTLAHNINKIWTAQTETKKPRARCRKVLDWLHLVLLTRQTREPDEAAFILHLDAPWGGGKTTFANFVARILNPTAHGYDINDNKKLKGTLLGGLPLNDESYWPRNFATRRWFVVDFNAWQNEHVSPPWWNFYQAIRRQCLRAILFEPGRFGSIGTRCNLQRDKLRWALFLCRFLESRTIRGLRRLSSWGRFQTFELLWKMWTPQVRNTVLVVLVSGMLLCWMTYSDWFTALTTPPAKGDSGATDFSPMLQGLFSLAGIAVTGGAGLAIVNAFRSGLKTLIDNAGNSTDAPSLGEADPVQKFRRHFSWFVGQLDEPVLVIVDDLDRCTPKYVVELVRGLLTIFRSPRVVFVLLGDKDWIETAFAKVYAEMADVHTEAQITFGERFAEKAIQLSFLLPAFDRDARDAYLTAILATSQDTVSRDAMETVEALRKVEAQARANLAATDSTEEQEAAVQRTEQLIREASANTSAEQREEFEKAATRVLDRERMLRAATARSTEEEVKQHGLKPLSDFLPTNPRRIKRIVNMVSAYQASAQSTQGVVLGSDRWKQLVIWVVIMSEYPQVWKTLVTDATLSTRLLGLIQMSSRGKPVVLPELSKDASDADKAQQSILATLLATPGLMPLLRGDPFAEENYAHSPACIDADASQWLRRLTPID
jgi:hypothetical protein